MQTLDNQNQKNSNINEENAIYVYYYDDIDAGRVKNVMAIISNIIGKEKPAALYFLFASRGGQVDAGVTFFNFLKSLPVKIIMHNIGVINSIANVIFLAGKKRYASPHSTFLFHGAAVPLNGNYSLPQLNEIKDSLDKDQNTIAGIVCDNTKMLRKTIEKLFLQGETKDVQFALKHGIIDEIKLPQMPQNARFVSINING